MEIKELTCLKKRLIKKRDYFAIPGNEELMESSVLFGNKARIIIWIMEREILKLPLCEYGLEWIK